MTIHFGDSTSLTTAPSASSGAVATGAGGGNSTNTSFVDMVSCTITPTQSDSHMMIVTTGTVGGEEGNNNNNRGTGTMKCVRGSTQIGDQIVGSNSNRNLRFDQVLLDTNDHGGSAVTYKLQLRKGGGNQAHCYMGAARSTNGSSAQGSARILVLEILQ